MIVGRKKMSFGLHIPAQGVWIAAIILPFKWIFTAVGRSEKKMSQYSSEINYDQDRPVDL